MAFRFDAGKLGKVERTPQGGIRVSAYLTRTGVFEYRRADGSIQRELRHPDQVFRDDSLATLQDATLTHLHPDRVTSKEYSKLAIGHTRDPKRADDNGVAYVEGVAVVQREDAVKKIDSGELQELSCGYSCDVINEPGEYNGERYDAIQTNIRYNHVALGPKNWGRAGNNVALRLDSAGDMVFDGRDEKMEFETIDGIQYKVGSTEHIQALRKDRDSHKGRADSLQVKVSEETSRADAAEGKYDALTKERNDAASEENIDKLVADRLTLREQAIAVLGKDYSFTRKDGDKVVTKTSREIMIDAVKKSDSAFDDKNVSDDYIRGRFATLVSVRKDSRATVKEAITIAQTPAKKKDADQRRKDAQENKRNLASKPLTLSKS